jgi:predicted amidophosphoribosyltransferase
MTEETTTCAGCGKTIRKSDGPLCDACIDAGE